MEIARLIRVFHPNPDDDFVTKRKSAIEDLAAQFGKMKSSEAIVSLSSAVSGAFDDEPVIPKETTNLVEQAIRNHSPSFVADDAPVEIGICSVGALLKVLESESVKDGPLAADVFAVALWLSLDLKRGNSNPRIEELRQEALAAARARIGRSGLISRNRKIVADFGSFGGTSVTPEEFATATNSTISSLKRNAVLDREEIDLLWWLLSEYSESLEVPMSSFTPTCRAIVGSLEVGRQLRRLPVRAHSILAMRGVDGSGTVTPDQLIDALAQVRSRLADAFCTDPLIHSCPSTFAFHSMLRSESPVAAQAVAGRPLLDIGARALLEQAFIANVRKEHRQV